MRRPLSLLTGALLVSAVFLSVAAPQLPPLEPRADPETTRLPNGKLQSEEILKAEHARSLADARELVKLAEEIQDDLEKNDRFVVSVPQVKRLDAMEKLVRKIRGRLTR